MNEQELKEVMCLLENAGVRAELCDTPIPLSVSGARCGMPTEIGDESIDDYILIPKVLIGPHPEMFITAIGDSMIEAGYEDGDMLRVRFGVESRDGKDMLMGGGTIFFEGDKKLYEAAGHCAAYHINGEDIFICHGYSIAHKGASILVRKPIRWSADGWPYLIDN